MAEPTCIDLLDWEDLRFFTVLARHRRIDVTGDAVLGEVAQMEMAACAILQQVARTNAGAKVPSRR